MPRFCPSEPPNSFKNLLAMMNITIDLECQYIRELYGYVYNYKDPKGPLGECTSGTKPTKDTQVAEDASNKDEDHSEDADQTHIHEGIDHFFCTLSIVVEGSI